MKVNRKNCPNAHGPGSGLGSDTVTPEICNPLHSFIFFKEREREREVMPKCPDIWNKVCLTRGLSLVRRLVYAIEDDCEKKSKTWAFGQRVDIKG